MSGLNIIRALDVDAAPYSSRSLTSLSKKKSQQSLRTYHGICDGDTTFLRARQLDDVHHLTMGEDSDTDEFYTDSTGQKNRFSNNFLTYLLCLLPPQWMNKIRNFIDIITASIFVKKAIDFIGIFLLWILYFVQFFRAQVGCLSLWKIRFRIAIRRLLWFMTLGKLGDLDWFITIFICAPCIFFLSAIGIILSIYTLLQKMLHNFRGYLRSRVF
ncbi:uncharacterized protein LOC142234226 [Haematobia irritans]|uniref:uncharacterized protein LOC142234226 n=1 Tax=Haematobia irritans TaxID=7368 RepID=UPI003F4F72A5